MADQSVQGKICATNLEHCFLEDILTELDDYKVGKVEEKKIDPMYVCMNFYFGLFIDSLFVTKL